MFLNQHVPNRRLSLPADDWRQQELLLLHNLTDQDITTINAIHVPIVHHTDLHTDHHKDKIHAIDINHVPTLEIDNFHSNFLIQTSFSTTTV